MVNRVVVWVVACALVLVGGLSRANAQDGSDVSTSRWTHTVEVTPFVSLGSTFSSRIGAAIAMAWTSALSIEVEIGYRRGEVNAVSSNASVLYQLPRMGRIAPYLAAGAGLAEYGSPLLIPGSGIVTQLRTAFTVNAGGGVKVPVDDKWGVRADARWTNALGRDGPEHWRVYNGVTFKR